VKHHKQYLDVSFFTGKFMTMTTDPRYDQYSFFFTSFVLKNTPVSSEADKSGLTSITLQMFKPVYCFCNA